MVELFEQDIRTNDRQSSKGNQLKWRDGQNWYKADFTGYEGLSEYSISQMLRFSSLAENEYVIYDPIQISYKMQIYNGVRSRHFLNEGWQIITLERLFQNFFGQSLNNALWSINNSEDRLIFLVNQVERITGLNEFGVYMNKVLTIDALFLNEDRHTHNLAVLMNGKGEYEYCPIFDNGAGLLSDTTLDYPMDGNIYNMIGEVKGKTFSTNLDEQLEVSEELYGNNIRFRCSANDIEKLFSISNTDENIGIYGIEQIERVKSILREQIRKYTYLFDG